MRAQHLEDADDWVEPEDVVTEEGIDDRSLALQQTLGEQGRNTTLAAGTRPDIEVVAVVTEREGQQDPEAPFGQEGFGGTVCRESCFEIHGVRGV